MLVVNLKQIAKLDQYQLQHSNNNIQKKKKMKKLINPTTYFFEQAEQTPTQIPTEVQEFSNKLLNKEKCLLCLKQYNTQQRIPRILIHCGHTFCTTCLQGFFMKNRVRCPMCLKLVKKLDNLERLPINHTIFAYLVDKQNKLVVGNEKKPAVKDAAKFLFSQFERIQKEAHRMENPQKIDQESGLPFCVFHSDRVEHFFCESHGTFGCRVCVEIGHSKPDCNVVDLYTVENPTKYQNLLQAKAAQRELPTGCFNPFVGDKKAFGFEGYMDPTLIDDDQEDGEHKSL